jgi:hypothetical protein
MRHFFYALCLFCSSNYALGVYKCVDQANKVSYQDTPCTAGSQRILKDLPSNSIKGPPTPQPTATLDPASITPTPREAATPTPIAKVDPYLPLTQNCSVDNPNRDPEFCRRKNLPGLYGYERPDRPAERPPIRPRPQPLR